MMQNGDKKILDLCGGTGAFSKQYKDNNYIVINVTLPKYDVRTYIPPDDVYGILAAPPCTEFSFAKTNSKHPRNIQKGMEIVYACLRIIWEVQYQLPTPLAKRTNLKFWVLENPFGLLRRFLGKPAFVFQPWEFGDMYKKKTCLWGYFDEPKRTNEIEPDAVKFDGLKTKEIHGEYYGQYDRTTRRAITPAGFAQAFYEANK